MKNKARVWIGIASVFIFVLNGVFIELSIGGYIGIGFAVCLVGLYWIGYKRASMEELSLGWLFLDFVCSALWSSLFFKGLLTLDQIGNHFMERSNGLQITSRILLGLLCFFLFGEVFALTHGHINRIKEVAISVVTINTMFYVFIPVSLMISNMDEYTFPISVMLISNGIVYVTVTLLEILLLASVVGKWYDIIVKIVVGILLGIYVQYMFLNYQIGSIGGVSYDFREHVVATVINCVVWCVLLAIPFFVEYWTKSTKVVRVYIPMFLLAIQLVSFATEIITAPKEAFEYKLYTFSGDEQYVVSSDENVVMFVFDSVDNSFAKDIIESEKYDFASFKDFYMYTNTCSIYDATRKSMKQMLTGGGFEEQLMDYVKAYQKMRDAGYTINFYGYEIDEPKDLVSQVDNFQLLSMEDPMVIEYFGIFLDSFSLTTYLTIPDVCKWMVATDQIDFTKSISFSDKKYFYENEDYYDNLQLVVNEESNKYFIVEHLNGAHVPNDGNDIATMYCFDIVKEYMNQLKTLGLYDQSTIIITADHGLHDDLGGFPYQTPSTPIFFIKMPNQVGESMRQLDTPVYHTDLMPTVLYAMGLYGENGQEEFGKTVFDFREDEKRERTFYNRAVPPYTYYIYTYTGNTKDLEEMFEKGDYVAK